MTMKKNDDAVSPVIGVILMVAITVILAAIIAAFVFGLVGTVEGAKVVGVTATKVNETAIAVTWTGGADLGGIDSADANLDGGVRRPIITDAPKVGDTNEVNMTENVTGKQFRIIATFKDGTEQIILERRF